jgi:hypothetical protein
VFSLRLNLLQICRPFDDSTANRLATKLIRTRGRSSPGLITAVLFFIPVGIATFWAAWTTGIACAGEIGLSLLIVGQLMNKITPGYSEKSDDATKRPRFRDGGGSGAGEITPPLGGGGGAVAFGGDATNLGTLPPTVSSNLNQKKVLYGLGIRRLSIESSGGQMR